MISYRSLCVLVLVAWPALAIVLGAIDPAPAVGAPGPPALSSNIVATFLDRRDPPATSYRARRRLEAENERFKKSGWLDVITELGPGGFRYEVLAAGGSEYVQNKVLRAALDGERDLIRTSSAGTLDSANYRFADDGVEGDLARIRMTPIRKDKLLVDGWLLVSASDADLISLKGRLAKTPSFWTTRVDVVRHYRRIAGVRVPVDLRSTAMVRFAGPSTFSMTYEYESINGVPVEPPLEHPHEP